MYTSAQSLFKLKHDDRLSGHDYTICKQAIKKSKYQKFFSNRIINILNNLPQDIINDKSINKFKNRFYLHDKELLYSIDINYYK